MASVTLRLNIKETEQALRRLRERANPAIARALNRANLAARTRMAQRIAADTRMKSGDVKEALVMRDATPASQRTELSASLKRIPVIRLGARGPEPSRGRGRGVTASTRTGRYPKAFIATMPSGHRGVFQRIRRSRLPIRELRGHSIGHVFEKYADEVMTHGLEALAKNLRSELRFALSQ
jgi:hypothetical protein